MDLNIREQYLLGLSSVNAKFIGAENTEELIACVQELLLNQPFKSKVLSVCGRPESYRASIELDIKNESEVSSFISTYTKNNGETIRISKQKKNGK